MGIKTETQYTKLDRFIKVANDSQEVPKFYMYAYKTPDTVDFDKVLSEGKKINGRLFEVYSKDKEFEGKKYKVYGWIFEDKDGIFNISVSEKVMQTWVNKIITADLTKELEISVFNGTSQKEDGKIYRNFAFRQNGQLLNGRISSQDKRDLVKETTNAAGEVTKDFSLITKTFKDMFEELKAKLEKEAKGLTMEDLEVEVEKPLMQQIEESVNDLNTTDAVKEKEKMIEEGDLPF